MLSLLVPLTLDCLLLPMFNLILILFNLLSFFIRMYITPKMSRIITTDAMIIVKETERLIAITVEVESVADPTVGGSVVGTMWCVVCVGVCRV